MENNGHLVDPEKTVIHFGLEVMREINDPLAFGNVHADRKIVFGRKLRRALGAESCIRHTVRFGILDVDIGIFLSVGCKAENYSVRGDRGLKVVDDAGGHSLSVLHLVIHIDREGIQTLQRQADTEGIDKIRHTAFIRKNASVPSQAHKIQHSVLTCVIGSGFERKTAATDPEIGKTASGARRLDRGGSERVPRH